MRHFNPASFVADAQITSRRNGKEENANRGEKKASRNGGWKKSEGGVTERTRVRAQGYSESLSGLESEV